MNLLRNQELRFITNGFQFKLKSHILKLKKNYWNKAFECIIQNVLLLEKATDVFFGFPYVLPEVQKS